MRGMCGQRSTRAAQHAPQRVYLLTPAEAAWAGWSVADAEDRLVLPALDLVRALVELRCARPSAGGDLRACAGAAGRSLRRLRGGPGGRPGAGGGARMPAARSLRGRYRGPGHGALALVAGGLLTARRACDQEWRVLRRVASRHVAARLRSADGRPSLDHRRRAWRRRWRGGGLPHGQGEGEDCPPGRRPAGEVEEALRSLRVGGGDVRYLEADILDARALGEAVVRAVDMLGPIAGVANAAMVLADRAIGGMDEVGSRPPSRRKHKARSTSTRRRAISRSRRASPSPRYSPFVAMLGRRTIWPAAPSRRPMRGISRPAVCRRRLSAGAIGARADGWRRPSIGSVSPARAICRSATLRGSPASRRRSRAPRWSWWPHGWIRRTGPVSRRRCSRPRHPLRSRGATWPRAGFGPTSTAGACCG